jgi:hypothetical protein
MLTKMQASETAATAMEGKHSQNPQTARRVGGVVEASTTILPALGSAIATSIVAKRTASTPRVHHHQP